MAPVLSFTRLKLFTMEEDPHPFDDTRISKAINCPTNYCSLQGMELMSLTRLFSS